MNLGERQHFFQTTQSLTICASHFLHECSLDQILQQASKLTASYRCNCGFMRSWDKPRNLQGLHPNPSTEQLSPVLPVQTKYILSCTPSGTQVYL